MDSSAVCSKEAVEYVWKGAIPLQIHLHESEVTIVPPPPPALVLGPRIGYLPLLFPILKSHFSSALPPGDDTIWFDYRGLPLKWFIPTGVLFDFLCAETERPWNLTVHFRGYPSDLLTPCDVEDGIKWSFINSLKEAAYIINGNCKNVMNMSQTDQLDLWLSVFNVEMEEYLRISSKLKLGPLGENCMVKKTISMQSRADTSEATSGGSNQTGRIPIRLYVRYIEEGIDDLEEATPVKSWDEISYFSRPVEINSEEGKYFTLRTALESLLPEFFSNEPQLDPILGESEESEARKSHELCQLENSKIKLIRIQGIEPRISIPLSWVFNNLSNPDFFLNICVFI